MIKTDDKASRSDSSFRALILELWRKQKLRVRNILKKKKRNMLNPLSDMPIMFF